MQAENSDVSPAASVAVAVIASPLHADWPEKVVRCTAIATGSPASLVRLRSDNDVDKVSLATGCLIRVRGRCAVGRRPADRILDERTAEYPAPGRGNPATRWSGD